MPYMGKVDVKASDIKRFSVTGSTSATHALSWTAPSEQALIITINGVKQHDGSYTIAGTPTTITLSSALVATDEMEVIGINDIGQTNTVAQDSIVTDMIRDNAVTTAKIADNQITTAKIADDQITSAKLANAINITSGNSLTIDSGATITNNGTASGFGGNNTPVFRAVGNSDQSLSVTTWTKVQLDSVDIDTDSGWDSGNYRWTVPTGEGGKYFISGAVRLYNAGGDLQEALATIYKNGSELHASWRNYWRFYGTGKVHAAVPTTNGAIELSAGDYIELYAYYSGGASPTITRAQSTHLTVFKLIE